MQSRDHGDTECILYVGRPVKEHSLLVSNKHIHRHSALLVSSDKEIDVYFVT